jgi:predicted dienelactone hydrolase
MKSISILAATTLLAGAIGLLPLRADVREGTRPAQPWSPTGALYSVRVFTIAWYDQQRNRPLPTTIYSPDDRGPFPVIIFSHGLGRSPQDYAYLGRCWAGRGYVAVFLQHNGSDDAVWHGTMRPKKALRDALEDPSNDVNRRRDIRFAIDQLEQMQTEATPVGKRLDMTRLALAGNDFGAQTVMEIAGQALRGQGACPDPRVCALLAMSPPAPTAQVSPTSAYEHIHAPSLYLTGTEDDGWVGTTRADQRRLPFDYGQGADRFLITLIGADHMVYAGHKVELGKAQKDAVYQRLISLSSVAFWDAYLKADPEAKAWLNSGRLVRVLGTTARFEMKLQPATL